MKTINQFLTGIFLLSVTLLFAGDPKYSIGKAEVNNLIPSVYRSELAPVTPKEAGFNDYDLMPFPAISHLAPITPKEATFEDLYSESNILFINPEILQKIAPETPREAGFEDAENESAAVYELLAPVTPRFAEFDE
jgi:hypothetical protein